MASPKVGLPTLHYNIYLINKYLAAASNVG